MSKQPSHRRRASSRAAVLAALAVAVVSLPARAQEPEPKPSTAAVEPPPSLRETAPESGAGLITGGTYAILGGTTLIVVGSYLSATLTNNWSGPIVGGVALAGGGATLVWLGSRRARKQRAWSEQHGLTPPPGGAALLISGLTLGGGGLISMIAYGGLTLGYCEQDCFNPNRGAWFGIAGSALGVGLGMIVAGGIVRHRHRRWREQDDVVRTRITPTFAFSSTGAQFGVAGRF